MLFFYTFYTFISFKIKKQNTLIFEIFYTDSYSETYSEIRGEQRKSFMSTYNEVCRD